MKLLLAILLFSSVGFTDEAEEYEKHFGETKIMGSADRKALEADRLKIGGIFQTEFLDSLLDSGTQNDFYQNPYTMRLYLDANMREDVRVYILGRYVYDPTISTTTVSPFTGQTQKADRGALDEAKLQFNMGKKVFWTVGIQKIKWGVGRFWNPTDFMNIERRNYFYTNDFRPGLPMIKAHVPIGNANVYGILMEQTGNEAKRNSGAVRIEVPFSAGEVSFTSLSKYNYPTWWGADFSVGIGDFDVYAEGAQRATNDRSAAGGLTYDFKYTDEDVVSLGVEAFWQEAGQTGISNYATMFTNQTFIPFYVGQFYTMAVLYLNKPGSWNDTNWSLYYIRNQSDLSDFWRAAFTYTGFRDVTWILSGALHGGAANTEFRIGGQKVDLSVLAMVNF